MATWGRIHSEGRNFTPTGVGPFHGNIFQESMICVLEKGLEGAHMAKI